MPDRSLTAAVSYGPAKPLTFEDLTASPLRSGEVLVRVAYAGICHTDLACHQGVITTRTPIVLGHEGAGTVVEVAGDVASVAPGARVAMSIMSCGGCARCLEGDVAYCEHGVELNIQGGGIGGSRTYPGTGIHSHFFGQSSFATLSVAHERNLVAVPGDVPLQLAAPLGCGVMTGAGAVLNALAVRPGRSVVVFGAGAVGLSAALMARLAGASPVIVADLVESRLELARQLGVDVTLQAADPDLAGSIRRHTGGGADFSVEASGSPVALRNAIDALGMRGVCASVGAVRGDVAFDARWLRIKGASVRGVSLGDANPKVLLPYLLDELRRGRFPLDRLVATYDFADINQAFEDAENGRAVKPVLVMPDHQESGG